MFSIVSKEHDAVMEQDVIIYKNEEDVTVKIRIGKEKHLDSKIFSILIKDPLSIAYGMSLSYSLGSLFLNIDRPIDYPIEAIDDILKNITRLKTIGDEIKSIIKQYE